MNTLNLSGNAMKIGANTYTRSALRSVNLKDETQNNKFEMSSDYYTSDEVNVRKNCSSGTFVNSTYLQNKIINSDSGEQTNSTKINRDVDSDYVASTEGLGEIAIRYLPFTSDCGNSSTGGSTSYAKNFDPENPVMVVRGKDNEGFYEAFVEINKINPRNCTAIEFEALKAYFISETDAPFLPTNFGNQEQSPYDTNDSNARFDLVEAYGIARSMNMFSSQGIAYDIDNAFDFFKGLWGSKFS